MEGNINTRVGNMNRVRSYYFKAVKTELFILPATVNTTVHITPRFILPHYHTFNVMFICHVML